MNENIDLTKILKDCPEGFKLYTPLYGEVEFKEILSSLRYAIKVSCVHSFILFTNKGLYYDSADAECVLFPSKTQRDWEKFTVPWYKKEKFDPTTLNPFDKVLVRDYEDWKWKVDFYSYKEEYSRFPYICVGSMHKYCIPYNDDTKHLVGTKEEAPEYYKYWDD